MDIIFWSMMIMWAMGCVFGWSINNIYIDHQKRKFAKKLEQERDEQDTEEDWKVIDKYCREEPWKEK